MRVGVVIVAAGSSSRMNGTDKLFTKISGKEVIRRTIENFNDNYLVDYIVVSTKKESIEKIDKIAKGTKTIAIVEGGKTRQESVYNAIKSCPKDTDIIMIQDGARPFTSQEIIKRSIEDCKKYGATIVAVRVKDTIKEVEDESIVSTPNRESLFAAQTPQTFKFKKYCALMDKAMESGENFTDDAQLFEKNGIKVHITEGEYKNKKITTIEDLEGEKVMLKIGHGYDVHRLKEGRKLIIGGVEIPYERGLDGHSDADVLVHAIMDSLLGAVGEKDIGNLFPDNKKEFEGISSLKLLSKVMEKISLEYKIGNIDATIIAQKPKLSLWIDIMKENIAKTCGIDINQINIKATTEEGLGFTGREEGIATHVVSIIERVAE